MLKRFYAVYNCYGNNVIGYGSLHVFESEADRDAWDKDDAENKKMIVKASNSLVRKYNSCNSSDGFRYTYHYANGRVSGFERYNGIEYSIDLY